VVAHGAEDALRLANDNDYGLSSAIFTRDVKLALDLAKRLNVGMSHINRTTIDGEPPAPFSGMKDSGYGCPGSTFGIQELTEIQWITIEGIRPPRFVVPDT
jgi:benzaldehyde dehydrogenase (NAD)